MPALMMRVALALPLAAALVAPRGPSSRPRGRLRQAADEYESTAVDGAFPADLEGTLYRLGPGSTLRRGEDRGARDAHGVVCGVTFADGGAVARSRFVRTEAYVREQRGYDAGSAGAERNTGSGAALYWAGKLYALTDGCKPYQLDPLSCATQKKSELGGLLTNPADGFAAWATEDGGYLVNAAVEPGLPFIGGDGLVYYEFDAAFRPRGGGDARAGQARLKLDKGDAVVDIAATASRYLAIVDDGDAVSLLAAPRGAAAGDATRCALPGVAPGSRVEVVDARDAGGGVALLAVVAPGPAPATGPAATRPFGALRKIDVADGGAGPASVADAGGDHALGAARVVGDDVYAADLGDGALVKLPLGGGAAARWRCDRGYKAGPATAAGDYVVALLHGDGETDVAVFGDNLAAGPVARAALPGALPANSLDGPFAADVAPSMKDLESSETLARLYARKSAEWNEVDGGFSGLGIKSFLFPKGVSGG